MKERFKFNTVGLFTRDNKATVDFYTKTFGFTTDWDGIQPNVEMTLGNMRSRMVPPPFFLQPQNLGASVPAMWSTQTEI